MIRNDSGQPLHHLTDWKPLEEPIPLGESRKVKLFYPGACVELIAGGVSRYFEVPIPSEESRLSGHWYATYSVVFLPDGLYFETDGRAGAKFKEMDDCDT